MSVVPAIVTWTRAILPIFSTGAKPGPGSLSQDFRLATRPHPRTEYPGPLKDKQPQGTHDPRSVPSPHQAALGSLFWALTRDHFKRCAMFSSETYDQRTPIV